MMLQIRDLRVDKGGRTICCVPELTVGSGERVALVGPNGSGKTTLLRVLSGLERDIHGECRIVPPMRKRVYVHQSPYLFRGTVMWNVGYGLAARNIDKKSRTSTVWHWLNVFGIGGLAERHCEKLSGGERRRVALARAFAIRPDLLLLDEPLADLDEEGIEIVCRAIADESESTIVIVSPVPVPSTLRVRLQSFAFPGRGSGRDL